MTYQTEFPDFANDTACAALAGRSDAWEDTSWGAEACPSFTCDVFVVWCDNPVAAEREFPEMARFCITCEGEEMLQSDDWADVLAFIDDGRRDFAAYAPAEVSE